MKKIFFFAALAVSAMLNAQTYDFTTFDFQDSDLKVTNGSVEYNEKSSYFEVKNKANETVSLTLAQVPNVKFTYKNSGEKTAFKVSPLKYIQMDGDQRDLTIEGLTPGTEITLSVASKGSTANSFEDNDNKGVGLTGCIWISGNKTQKAKVDGSELVFEDVTVQAIASTVTIRTTAGGYCLNKIVIGGGTSAVENIEGTTAKATKVIENGQIYLLKNGVKYNVLGAQVAE